MLKIIKIYTKKDERRTILLPIESASFPEIIEAGTKANPLAIK